MSVAALDPVRACAATDREPPRRIIHVLDHSLPVRDGYVTRTLSILAAQRALGWSTVHLTSPRQENAVAEDEEVDGWRFARTPRPRGRRLIGYSELLEMRALARRLDRLVGEVQPDIIHAHSPVLNGWPGLRVARRHRIPFVYEIRAFWEDAAVDQGKGREGDLRWRAVRAAETALVRRADAVFTICDGLRRDLEGRGIDPRKLHVVPNAVELDRFSPARAADPKLRAQLGLDGSIVLGFIGSFYAYEGLALLIDAVAELRRSEPRMRLLLVGGDHEESNLREKVFRLGLEGTVLLPGRVPHAEVGRWYDLVDLFVYPRLPMRLTDLVTPLKPLEAMAAGRVVVASDVGGHKELIRDGETGFLFDAGSRDALVQCLTSVIGRPGCWPAVARRARTFVETHRTWKRSARAYVEPYRGLMVRAR